MFVRITDNIFSGIAPSSINEYYKPNPLNDIYRPSKRKFTTFFQNKHNKTPKINEDIINMLANDVDILKCCNASQHVIDIFYKQNISWNEFTANKSFNNLLKTNPDIYNTFRSYEPQFRRSMYIPLSSLKATDAIDLFNGNPSDLISKINQIIDYFKVNKPTKGSLSFVYKSDPNKVAVKSCNVDANDVARLMRQSNVKLDDNDRYKQFEMFGNQITEIPVLMDVDMPEGTFCKLYNCINIVKKGGIATVFIVDNECICVYLFVADDQGQVYGVRIFQNDLLTVIPSLYYNKVVTDIHLIDWPQDKLYKEYEKYLKPDINLINDNDDDDDKNAENDVKYDDLSPKQVIRDNDYNDDGDINPNQDEFQLIQKDLKKYIHQLKYKVNIHEIITFFAKNNINYAYFDDNKADFVSLITKKCNIKIIAARKLWEHFALKQERINYQNTIIKQKQQINEYQIMIKKMCKNKQKQDIKVRQMTNIIKYLVEKAKSNDNNEFNDDNISTYSGLSVQTDWNDYEDNKEEIKVNDVSSINLHSTDTGQQQNRINIHAQNQFIELNHYHNRKALYYEIDINYDQERQNMNSNIREYLCVLLLYWIWLRSWLRLMDY